MTPTQRSAAERLAPMLADIANAHAPSAAGFAVAEAADLLRELLAAEPVQESSPLAGTMAEQFLQVVAGIWHDHPDYSIRQALDALNATFPAEPVEYKRGYEEALNDCIRNGMAWARSMFANNAEHIEPVQEPAIWIQSNHLQHAQNGPHFARTGPTKLQSDYVPLYAHPPQQRVPLTKVQLWSLPEMRGWFPQDHYRLEALARAIERAHGITGEPT